MSPPGREAALRDDFQRMTFSLRPLTREEAAGLVPLTVEILQVPPGATTETLAAGLPFADLKVERFRVLNGFDPGEEPRSGQKVKIIAE